MARYSAKDTERLKERILDETEKLILENGVRNLTMRDLAKTVGVSPTTPYNLFGSKGHLLSDCLVRDLMRDIQSLSFVPNPNDGIVEIFKHLENIYVLIQKKEYFVRQLFLGIVQNNDELSLEGKTAMIEMMLTALLLNKVQKGELNNTVPPNVLAKQLVDSTVGTVILWVANAITTEQLLSKVKISILLCLSPFALGNLHNDINSQLTTLLQAS